MRFGKLVAKDKRKINRPLTHVLAKDNFNKITTIFYYKLSV